MEFSITGPLADRRAAWRLVGDTDYLNRVGGNPPLLMTMQPDELGFPALRGTMLGPVGIRHSFEEVDHRWVQGRFFMQHRQVRGPLLRETLYQAVLDDQGAGALPTIRLRMEPSLGVLSTVLRPAFRALRRQWQRRLDSLPAPGEPVQPEVLRSVDHGAQAALDRWRDRGAPDLLVSRVRGLFERARAWELTRIRPYQLADRWGQPREQVLAWFIEGTAVGVFEMHWSVICPRCRGSVSTVDALGGVLDHASCPSCRFDFEVDLHDTVEVVFVAPPSLAPRVDEHFCTLYPARRADVLAMAVVGPGQQVQLDVDLEPGRWKLVTASDVADVDLTVGDQGPDELDWRPRTTPTRRVVRAGPTRLRLHNPRLGRLRVSLVGDPATAAIVSAAELATSPVYRGIYGPQVLAPDVRVRVSAVAVLFTDLTDSTALYASLGDAAAFAFVRDHFRVLEDVVQRHDGVRVKTIGDAMMAAFHEPLDAARAALEMQGCFQRFSSAHAIAHPPRLRVGVHVGPALGVHTDAAGLDYFGGTVNLAARAVSNAQGDQVVWTRALHRTVGIDALLGLRGWMGTSFEARLKGLARPVELWRVVREREPASSM